MTLNSDTSHGVLLSDSLQRLKLESSSLSNDVDDNQRDHETERDELANLPSPSSRLLNSVVHEGYGFRPTSGSSTPQSAIRAGSDSPLPDRHGLGWPGTICV